MAEPQAAMDDFLHGGQVSDMTEEINILKKKMRELEGLSVPAAESLLYYANSTYYALPDNLAHDIFSFTIAGGDLSTNHIIEGEVTFLHSGDGSAGHIITFTLTYKLTAISFAIVVPTTGSVTDQVIKIYFSISGNGATNAQYMTCAANRFDQAGDSNSVSGTAAVDSTANETAKITAQRNDASCGGKFIYGRVFLIQP